LQRFAELGELELCDAPAARGLVPLLRNYVAFNSSPDTAAWSRQEIVREFLKHIASLSGPAKYRFSPVTDDGDESRVEVAWYKDQFHGLSFRRVDSPTGRWLAWHRGNLGVSELIDRWLKSDARFSDVRWYSRMPEERPAEWRVTPW